MRIVKNYQRRIGPLTKFADASYLIHYYRFSKNSIPENSKEAFLEDARLFTKHTIGQEGIQLHHLFPSLTLS